MELPVARVAVDVPLSHLDRPFDYAVPPDLDARVVPGGKVRVRFAGQRVDGWVLDRVADTDVRRLSPILRVVSSEPLLSPEIMGLCREVADRCAGTFGDVARLAVPPRHARVENEVPAAFEEAVVNAPQPGRWEDYEFGSTYLTALTKGRSPRAVWWALPGSDWPQMLARAAAATIASGRGVLMVVPDRRDLARLATAVAELIPRSLFGALEASRSAESHGPTARYRTWLAVRRGTVRCVLGTRAAAWAPVHDLGLVVCWDDGDDLHKEPRAPYPHVRDVLALRSHRERAGLLIGGHSPSAEAVRWVDAGWAKPLVAPRAVVRDRAPRVEIAGTHIQLARDAAAATARLPTLAWQAVKDALAQDLPVLVQVPRVGYHPSLVCVDCRAVARCGACHGPVSRERASGRDEPSAPLPPPACKLCGRPAADWSCSECGGSRVRPAVIGSERTVEELGRAFPEASTVMKYDRTSDHFRPDIPEKPALVVATPGAEPVAEGGYGAVLLLDGWALLSRADLRAGEEALRRWTAAAALARPAKEGGRVVVMADAALAPVQALLRWDPAWFARRELADRAALSFPPAVRMAAVDGSPRAVAEVVAALPEGADVLGPVPYGEGERALVRVPREHGRALAAALKAAMAARSARKATDPVRVELDPLTLI